MTRKITLIDETTLPGDEAGLLVTRRYSVDGSAHSIIVRSHGHGGSIHIDGKSGIVWTDRDAGVVWLATLNKSGDYVDRGERLDLTPDEIDRMLPPVPCTVHSDPERVDRTPWQKGD